MSIQKGLKIKDIQKEGGYGTGIQGVANAVDGRRKAEATERTSSGGGKSRTSKKVSAGKESTPKKSKKESRSRTGRIDTTHDTSTEDISNVISDQGNPTSMAERTLRKKRSTPKPERASVEGEVKTKRRSRKEKIKSSEASNELEEERSRPTKEKSHLSKPEESDKEVHPPEKESKSKNSRKERKSKTSNAVDFETGSAAGEEKSKPRKSKKERRLRTGDDTALISKERSRRKDKKSSTKSQDVASKSGANGLSAMIEPWALLETVVKSHREEVHVLKDIMDLQAARTGDRKKLHELEKLLTRIDKEKPSGFVA